MPRLRKTGMSQPRKRGPRNHAMPPFAAAVKHSGFTLIEVLVALAIVSIGLLAIAGLQARAIGGNRAARMQTEATALAARTLEHLRLLPFDHPDLASDPSPHRLAAAGNSAYNVHWTVIDDKPVAGTKTVYIQVGWSGGTNARAVRMRTIIADRL